VAQCKRPGVTRRCAAAVAESVRAHGRAAQWRSGRVAECSRPGGALAEWLSGSVLTAWRGGGGVASGRVAEWPVGSLFTAAGGWRSGRVAEWLSVHGRAAQSLSGGVAEWPSGRVAQCSRPGSAVPEWPTRGRVTERFSGSVPGPGGVVFEWRSCEAILCSVLTAGRCLPEWLCDCGPRDTDDDDTDDDDDDLMDWSMVGSFFVGSMSLRRAHRVRRASRGLLSLRGIIEHFNAALRSTQRDRALDAVSVIPVAPLTRSYCEEPSTIRRNLCAQLNGQWPVGDGSATWSQRLPVEIFASQTRTIECHRPALAVARATILEYFQSPALKGLEKDLSLRRMIRYGSVFATNNDARGHRWDWPSPSFPTMLPPTNPALAPWPTPHSPPTARPTSKLARLNDVRVHRRCQGYRSPALNATKGSSRARAVPIRVLRVVPEPAAARVPK